MRGIWKHGFYLGALGAPTIGAGAAWGPGGACLALASALALAGYHRSDAIVLALSGARLVKRHEAPGLYRVVTALAMRAGVPLPRLYLVPDATPNAFTLGRNPHHAAIVVTRGLLATLGPDELEGAMAHELAHIRNRDTWLASMVAMCATPFLPLAWGANGRARGLRTAIARVAGLGLRLVMRPEREFEADRLGARWCKDPRSLERALRKLEQAGPPAREVPTPATVLLGLVSPLPPEHPFAQAWGAHPETRERIERMRRLPPTSRS